MKWFFSQITCTLALKLILSCKINLFIHKETTKRDSHESIKTNTIFTRDSQTELFSNKIESTDRKRNFNEDIRHLLHMFC